jgi:hypothetical protein
MEYLEGNPSCKITYRPSDVKSNLLSGCADSDRGNSSFRRSTSGMLMLYNKSLMSGKSKMQKTLSTAEAEYYSASTAASRFCIFDTCCDDMPAYAYIRVEYGLDWFGTSMGRTGWPDSINRPATPHDRLQAAVPRDAPPAAVPNRVCGPWVARRSCGPRPATEGATGCRTRMGPGSRVESDSGSEGGARHRSGQADVDVTSHVF